MKINRLLSLLTLSAVSLIVLQSNQGGLNNAIVANNPTTAGCNCHGPAVSSPNGLKLEVLDANNVPQLTYVPNTNYTVRVTLTKNNATDFAGFQAAIFNAGTATQGGNPADGTLCKKVNIGGTNVINHTQKDVSSLKVGNLVTWTFPWQSPLISQSDLTLHAIANDANGDNGTGGDAIVYNSMQISRIGVGVEDYSKGIEAIYPNPTTDNVSIDLESPESSKIAIYTIAGKLVKQIDATGNKVKFTVSELVAGNYFLTVTQGNKVAKQQFSKF